ncbi:uncharacterized protein [Temnothorax longispinosus]|uniref:Uncharacterized protein n=1 Tax=Temnothorax longispinosus TaxID=300112 RepID=A0A4V3SBU9_9HYME|nr:Uncharacterized protein DBV15_10661 [Temnothorax longispinosus]
MMRCIKYKNGKRSHLSEKKGVESVTMTTNGKANRKNDSSPRGHEQSGSSHSTPIAKNPSTNADAENSPDLDYSPSLILPPCTQEGGNEVAWDWQSSLSRTPENRNKRQNVQCETPKGTKLLQRKRNSNSPLLYKPLKRKTIKMENMENIGQFAAELQALNEKMRVIKQNDKSDCIKEKEAPTLTNVSNEENTSEIKDKQNSIGESGNNNGHNSVGETHDRNEASKKQVNGSYDDLFDDSVDDDIIRCTQEIEEKFNLMDKGSSVFVHSQVTQVKKEELHTNDVPSKTSVQSGSSENCTKPLVRSVLGASDSNTLKTYSKLSLKRDTSSSTCVTAQKSKDPYKPCPNNNNTISRVQKPCDNKKLTKSNTADLFDLEDDSFDDWLVTCVEDEKLLPKSDGSLTRKDDSTKCQANYKRLTNAPLKSETKSADSLNPMAKPETSNVSLLENRKFFKTKSLSDQYVSRDASTNAKGTGASCYATRPTLQHSSRGSIPHMGIARTLVSTKPIVTNVRKIENNAFSLMHDTGQTRGSDVNRYAVKSDGDRFVKHHSTGNMKNDTPEMTKTGSQPARCTAEEIERKRLQAVAKLEAKRKLYFTKIKNNVNR